MNSRIFFIFCFFPSFTSVFFHAFMPFIYVFRTSVAAVKYYIGFVFGVNFRAIHTS